jgi:hypothetical protein
MNCPFDKLLLVTGTRSATELAGDFSDDKGGVDTCFSPPINYAPRATPGYDELTATYGSPWPPGVMFARISPANTAHRPVLPVVPTRKCWTNSHPSDEYELQSVCNSDFAEKLVGSFAQTRKSHERAKANRGCMSFLSAARRASI